MTIFVRRHSSLPWIIVVGVLVHGYWGVASLFWPETFLTTPINPIAEIFYSNVLVSLTLIGAATLAGLSIHDKFNGNLYGFIMLLPLQYLITVSFVGGVLIALNGQYPDGYVPTGNPHAFIISDQIGYGIIAFVHSLAFIDLYFLQNGFMSWIHR